MRTLSTSILGLLAAIVIAGCSALGIDGLPGWERDPKQPLRDELEANVATWEAAGVDRYAFTFRPSCFCPRDPHLVVVEGAETRIDGVPVGPDQEPWDTPAGVPGLFELVRRAIEGDSVTVTYDPVTGVPLAMDSDPIEAAIDDEFSFTVEEWTDEPPDDRLLGEVTRARALWRDRQPVSYSMTFRTACDGCGQAPETYELTVRGGETVVRSGDRTYDADDLAGLPLTVEGLFDGAMYAATRSLTDFAADPELGYPTLIASDERAAGGDHWTTTTLEFTTP